MTYTITIPIELPSANNLLRMHWAERKRLKDIITCLARASRHRPKEPLTKAKVTVIMIRRRKLTDADNLTFTAGKLVCDALQSAGIITNDDMTTIGQVQVQQYTLKEGKSKEPKTIIEVQSEP